MTTLSHIVVVEESSRSGCEKLRHTIEQYVREYDRETGLEVDLNLRELPEGGLGGQQNRALQGALRNTNTRRHAGASRVHLGVTHEHDSHLASGNVPRADAVLASRTLIWGVDTT